MIHPPPEVSCRLAIDAEIPGGAKRVKKFAEANGWRVFPSYARGTQLGRNPKIVESVVLRLSRDRSHAVAAWHDGKLSCAYVWRAGEAPSRVTAAGLRARIGET